MGTNNGKHNILKRAARKLTANRFALIKKENAAGEAICRSACARGLFLLRDTSADAVVEATVLFPVMIMIFAALVMLAIYLPAQAVLQQSTQYAATALATEISDTWLSFDTGSMSYYRQTDKYMLPNVYEELFSSNRARISANGTLITQAQEQRSMSAKAGELMVICRLRNAIIYKEVTVEAYRKYDMPVTLTIIGFPETIILTASSTAVVQNGDEFIRNIDLATDFLSFVIEKFELNDITQCFSSINENVKSMLGW